MNGIHVVPSLTPGILNICATDIEDRPNDFHKMTLTPVRPTMLDTVQTPYVVQRPGRLTFRTSIVSTPAYGMDVNYVNGSMMCISDDSSAGSEGIQARGRRRGARSVDQDVIHFSRDGSNSVIVYGQGNMRVYRDISSELPAAPSFIDISYEETEMLSLLDYYRPYAIWECFKEGAAYFFIMCIEFSDRAGVEGEGQASPDSEAPATVTTSKYSMKAQMNYQCRSFCGARFSDSGTRLMVAVVIDTHIVEYRKVNISHSQGTIYIEPVADLPISELNFACACYNTVVRFLSDDSLFIVRDSTLMVVWNIGRDEQPYVLDSPDNLNLALNGNLATSSSAIIGGYHSMLRRDVYGSYFMVLWRLRAGDVAKIIKLEDIPPELGAHHNSSTINWSWDGSSVSIRLPYSTRTYRRLPESDIVGIIRTGLRATASATLSVDLTLLSFTDPEGSCYIRLFPLT